ncbi:hypothetical protein [Candidatus Thiosymbion oneisti]|uniref:hypothetical protein n=1 Tax=Candidatus Thiosymbion oneisti TaxID=589554 RepID=UPI000AE17A1C|nr:hypothetical protein [Candidatus Thiosymbion oneisti]
MSFENLWAWPLLLLPPLAFLKLRVFKRDRTLASLLYFRDLVRREWLPRWELEVTRERWIYALLLLVGAVIALGPVLPLPTERVLLVLDDSASMQAVAADGKSRFEHARRALLTAGRAQLVTGGEVRLQLLWGPNSALEGIAEAGELERELASTTPRAYGGTLATRLEGILGQAKADGVTRVILATDHPLAPQSEYGGLEWIDITAVIEPGGLFSTPARHRLVLRNFSSETADAVTITLSEMSDRVGSPVMGPFSLAPGEAKRLSLERLLTGAGLVGSGPHWLSVRAPDDALGLDDGLWVFPHRDREIQVLLIRCKPGGALWPWLTPHPEIRRVIVDDPQQRPGGHWDLVIHDRCPNPPWLSDVTTDTIVIAPNPGNDRTPHKVRWQSAWYDNPIMRDIKPLYGMLLHHPRLGEVPDADWFMPLFSQSQIAIRGLGGQAPAVMKPAYAAERAGKRYLYLGFDAHFYCDSTRHGGGTFRQDDCLSMVFLLMNAMEWMTGEGPSATRYLPAGAMYAGTGRGKPTLLDTQGDPFPPMSETASARWVLDAPGHYLYRSDIRKEHLSVGLLDERESELAPRPVRLQQDWDLAASGSRSRPVWRWLVGLLVLLGIAESL